VTETVNETAALGLTPEQVKSFDENGFIGPFDLYPEDQAPLIWNQALIEMVTSKNKPHNSTVINYDRHLDCDTLSQHITHPVIVHKLRSLMGDDIICWKTNIFEKNPGGDGTGWHQVETHMLYESDDVAHPSVKYTEETKAVTQELTALDGVRDVAVELVPDGTTLVTVTSAGPLDDAAVRAAIDEAGYDIAR